jgi:hypothetical protein
VVIVDMCKRDLDVKSEITKVTLSRAIPLVLTLRLLELLGKSPLPRGKPRTRYEPGGTLASRIGTLPLSRVLTTLVNEAGGSHRHGYYLV